MQAAIVRPPPAQPDGPASGQTLQALTQIGRLRVAAIASKQFVAAVARQSHGHYGLANRVIRVAQLSANGSS